jgi:hypothetical protein
MNHCVMKCNDVQDVKGAEGIRFIVIRRCMSTGYSQTKCATQGVVAQHSMILMGPLRKFVCAAQSRVQSFQHITCSASGTSLETMRWARPSATAV